ncbi:ubiquitin-associated domain-containing protein 1-like [Dreissena polymorpha]|uniref:Ubiquitin-associated domain-containing protein 1 n=1 Tax=Dreissena polymorpha TaxID=45954 RepID=A0A9D4IMA4_DREPO|nr:ubiquitin-associated domain-containing protein 1-like [Dreissena polymorpha]KAH3778114.1 hypothetical protein DPMN_179567 [Dreissena polymorpha]
MFVSDTNIFPSSGMKIRISCPDGSDLFLSFLPEATVDNLKVAALRNILTDSASSLKESLYYKIILVRTCKSLEDEKTLLEQGVQDNDEVLLLKRRLLPSQFEKSSDKNKQEEIRSSPTAADIQKATSGLPVTDTHTCQATVSSTVDFQTELRKILISLIEVSQKLLCLNPEASKIFEQAEEILHEPSSSRDDLDDDSIQQLTAMGFPEHRARKALKLNKLSVMSAMDWLLQHGDDPDIDQPLPDNTDTLQSLEGEVGAEGGTATNLDDTGTDISRHRVSNILKSLRAYKKREFKPNPKVLQHLLEMGFDEKSCVEALRATRNNGDAACEMLLNNRKPPPDTLDEGIDPESPMFRAIMANPVVQLGLNNPRCLLAFIQMLEHPHTANQWLSDPETAPLLVHISRIYHAEKHSHQQQQHETSTAITQSR